MPYPFPGMNPWPEHQLLWHSVHHSIIAALSEELTPLLRPRYFAVIETHIRIGIKPDTPILSASGTLLYHVDTAVSPGTMSEARPYLTVELPQSVEEGYIEIRHVSNGEVVTVIELLSHSNKQPGKDRETYIEKRDALLDSRVNFVEIDLLRAGPPMPHTEKGANSHYRLFIRRSVRPREARLYPFSVRQPIPTFPLPLRADDAEPTVDLGELIKRIYERAGYDLVLKYDQPPTPPLTPEDSAWAAALLATAPPQQHSA